MLSPEGGGVVIVVIVALAVLVVLGAGAWRTTAEHSTDGGARDSRGRGFLAGKAASTKPRAGTRGRCLLRYSANMPRVRLTAVIRRTTADG